MCCGGIKKLFLATGLALGLVAVLSMTKLGSYMKVCWNRGRDAVVQAVPIEDQIAVLKEEVKKLTPALDKNMSIVANEQASIERLEKEINTVKDNLVKHKDRLLGMGKDLDSGATEFIYGGKVYDRKEVAQRFSLDWESFKRAEAELKTKQQVLEARRQKLAIAKDQLAAMKDQQSQLELQIAQLETDLQMVRLAQTKNTVQLDDSRLSDVKRSVADLQERINAEKIKSELEGQYFPNKVMVGADTPAPRPISELIKEMRDHVGENKISTDNTK